MRQNCSWIREITVNDSDSRPALLRRRSEYRNAFSGETDIGRPSPQFGSVRSETRQGDSKGAGDCCWGYESGAGDSPAPGGPIKTIRSVWAGLSPTTSLTVSTTDLASAPRFASRRSTLFCSFATKSFKCASCSEPVGLLGGDTTAGSGAVGVPAVVEVAIFVGSRIEPSEKSSTRRSGRSRFSHRTRVTRLPPRFCSKR